VRWQASKRRGVQKKGLFEGRVLGEIGRICQFRPKEKGQRKGKKKVTTGTCITMGERFPSSGSERMIRK